MIDVTHRSGRASRRVLGLGRSGLRGGRGAAAAGGAESWPGTTRRPSATPRRRPGVPLVDLGTADLADVAALVLSPGIPHTYPEPHPVAARARAAGAEIIGDIELLARSQPPGALCRHHRHQRQIDDDGADRPHPARRPGARSRSAAISARRRCRSPPLGAGGIYVLEMSSYQLELTREPRPSTSPCCSTSRPTISTAMAAWTAMSPPSERIFARQQQAADRDHRHRRRL